MRFKFHSQVKNNNIRNSKFETHVARLLPFDVTLHDFQNLGEIIRFREGNDGNYRN